MVLLDVKSEIWVQRKRDYTPIMLICNVVSTFILVEAIQWISSLCSRWQGPHKFYIVLLFDQNPFFLQEKAAETD